MPNSGGGEHNFCFLSLLNSDIFFFKYYDEDELFIGAVIVVLRGKKLFLKSEDEIFFNFITNDTWWMKVNI